MFLPSNHSCLTAVHKDGLEPSQNRPTTTSPLQLWSYRVVQVMDCEETIFYSRWVVHIPHPAYQVRGRVSSTHTLHHLSCLCTRIRMWCVPLVVVLFVIVDDIIYRGISPVGNLNYHDLRGVDIIAYLVLRMTQPPLWGRSPNHTWATVKTTNIV